MLFTFSIGKKVSRKDEKRMKKIKIGILGYGNLGKGVEMAMEQNPDMELVAVFTRRDPKDLTVASGCPVYSVDEAEKMKDTIDVMILCGGSATDLPEQGPKFAAIFNTIDSFDTHAKVPQYYEGAERSGGKKRPYCHHVCGLGSGSVFVKPHLCPGGFAGGRNVYLLGKRRQPGTF